MKRARRFIVPAILCLLVLALALYAAGVRVEVWFGDREYTAYVVVACDPPTGYEQGDGIGYLTIPYTARDVAQP